MKAKARACELCRQEAILHCASDDAFLCIDCDARVHKANFLVARHVRQTLCSQCKCLTGNFLTGERSTSLSPPICPSCSTIVSSTASSDCISSTESSVSKKMSRSNHIRKEHKRVINACSSSVSDISDEISDKPPRREKMVDSKAVGIFLIWCRRLGLNDNGDSVVSFASQALELCLERSTVLSFRVCLAASFWTGLRICADRSVGSWQNLRRLEAVSGVPAKLIVAVETKLARVMTARRRSRQDMQEGWAECNV